MNTKKQLKKLLYGAICISLSCFATKPQKIEQSTTEKALKRLEETYHGRIGVFALNTKNKRTFHYRATEPFPLASTAKLMVVAAVLKKGSENNSWLNQTVHYTKQTLITYSPITKQHIDSGMTIRDLCQAAIIVSDNTAMNLLIKQLGGINAVNQFAHSIGNKSFRLDRLEPNLNSAIPGDLRDTSTPSDMAYSLQTLLLSNELKAEQQKQLVNWLINNKTGDEKIRAGVPKDWIVGDKTGAGDYGTTNDIAIIWPPNQEPIILAIYFTQSEKSNSNSDHIIAEASKIVANEILANF